MIGILSSAKSPALALGILALGATVVCAEEAQIGRSVSGGAGGRLINAPYVTTTGATVPNPGVSQNGGTTPLDLGIQRRDTEITEGICKGC